MSSVRSSQMRPPASQSLTSLVRRPQPQGSQQPPTSVMRHTTAASTSGSDRHDVTSCSAASSSATSTYSTVPSRPTRARQSPTLETASDSAVPVQASPRRRRRLCQCRTSRRAAGRAAIAQGRRRNRHQDIHIIVAGAALITASASLAAAQHHIEHALRICIHL